MNRRNRYTEYDLFKYNCHHDVFMYVALAVTISAILSVATGFSIEQAFGQANMTTEMANLTAGSSNMTEDGNATSKGGVSALQRAKMMSGAATRGD